MLKLRYILRLISAFVARFKAIIVFGILVGTAAFFAIGYLGKGFLNNKVVQIGITGRYDTTNLPSLILNEIGDGLTSISESGVVEPSLARVWSTPDKGITWVFELNDNLTWQDGAKVESSQLNYNFSDAKVEYPDQNTINFILESPLSSFPSVVSAPIFRQGLLGTGDWKVTKISLSGGYVQKLEVVNKGKEKIIYKFYPTEERTKLAYKLGEVDKIVGIFNPDPINTWKTTETHVEINKNRYVVIFFNAEDKFLSEKNIRQALSYAINKESFESHRVIGPIPPNSWAYNPQVKPYNYDSQRSQELLDELPDELKSELSINLVTTPVLLQAAEAIAKDWEKVGVKTHVQVSSGVPEQYQALLAIFDAPADPDQYGIWHSTQTNGNFSNYKNPRIDKLLEDGRVELSTEERKRIYLDFQRFLMEDAPAVFLYHPQLYTISRN